MIDCTSQCGSIIRESSDTYRFLDALFSPYESRQNLLIESRTLAPKSSEDWNPRPTQRWFGMNQLGEVAQLSNKQANTRNVYIGVLPRSERLGSADAVNHAAYLFADVDGGVDGLEEATKLVKTAPIPSPNIAVLSGNGLHAYWLLSDVVVFSDKAIRDRFREVLRRLATAIGGEAPGAHADTACAEPARILRVPGTLNLKDREDPKPVRLLRLNFEDFHSFSWWRANLPAERAPILRSSRPIMGLPSLPPRTRDLLANPSAQGSRHTTCVKALVSAYRSGFTGAGLQALACHFAAVNGLSAREVGDILRWVERRCPQ